MDENRSKSRLSGRLMKSVREKRKKFKALRRVSQRTKRFCCCYQPGEFSLADPCRPPRRWSPRREPDRTSAADRSRPSRECAPWSSSHAAYRMRPALGCTERGEAIWLIKFLVLWTRETIFSELFRTRLTRPSEPCWFTDHCREIPLTQSLEILCDS